jgi:hypothetical protein
MTHKDDSVYVLGSGASLLTLTPEEKEYLQGQTTVAMNKYLLFWHIVGVYPKWHFLADQHYPALRIMQESYLLTQEMRRPVQWLLHANYRDVFGLDSEQAAARAEQVERYKTDYGFGYQPTLRIDPVTYFERSQDSADIAWAESLDEPMANFRGSLSTLINLLCVLDLGRTIKLLGVDLSSSESFYDAEYLHRRDLHDVYTRLQLSKPRSMHFTALPWYGKSGIQGQMGTIVSLARAAGHDIVCCNPHSLLVEQGVCEFAPVLPA